MNSTGARKSSLASMLLLGFLLVAGSAFAKDTCLECHQSDSHRIKNKKLYEYYQKYINSVHGVAEIGCAECHGGDPESNDMKIAHAGVMENVSYRNIPKTCGSCHEEQLKSFRESDHFSVLEHDGRAPNCVTCHGSMDVDVYFASVVKNTCVLCHNPDTGNHPDVPHQAEYVLSQINIINGYRGLIMKYSPDSKALPEIDESYALLTRYWHEFNLHQVSVEAEHLLGILRVEKAKALQDKKNKKTND